VPKAPPLRAVAEAEAAAAPRQPDYLDGFLNPQPEPAEAPARKSRQESSGNRRDSSQDEDRQGGKPIVGFGSDLPAFLTRPTSSGQK
jgi:hypothetical protein